MARSIIVARNRRQFVHLPAAVAFPDEVDHVDIIKIGKGRLITPKGDRWDDLFDGGARLTDDFMRERHQPAVEEREW